MARNVYNLQVIASVIRNVRRRVCHIEHWAWTSYTQVCFPRQQRPAPAVSCTCWVLHLVTHNQVTRVYVSCNLLLVKTQENVVIYSNGLCREGNFLSSPSEDLSRSRISLICSKHGGFITFSPRFLRFSLMNINLISKVYYCLSQFYLSLKLIFYRLYSSVYKRYDIIVKTNFNTSLYYYISKLLYWFITLVMLIF